jgi:hypothetical protein
MDIYTSKILVKKFMLPKIRVQAMMAVVEEIMVQAMMAEEMNKIAIASIVIAKIPLLLKILMMAVVVTVQRKVHQH